jgi:hypothetical protein
LVPNVITKESHLEDYEDLNGAAQTVEEVMVSKGELNGFK